MSQKNCREYFGERLKLLRNSKKMSQQELAEKLGVSKGSLGFYETCKNTPDIEFLDRTAIFFDVSVDYLLGRSEVKTDKKTEAKAVCDYLGISEKALNEFTKLKDEPRCCEMLNSLLEFGLFSCITVLTAQIYSSKALIANYENLAFINLEKGKAPSDEEKVNVLCHKLAITETRKNLVDILLKVVDAVTSYTSVSEEMYNKFKADYGESEEVEKHAMKMLGHLPFTDEDNEIIMQILYGKADTKSKNDKKDGENNG